MQDDAASTATVSRQTKLERLTRFALRTPRGFLVAALLGLAAAALFAVPVTKSLSVGGLQDPKSQSSRTAGVLLDKFGISGMPMLFELTSDAGVDSPNVRRLAADIESRLGASPYVMDLSSAWSGSPETTRRLVSEDRRSGLIVAGLTGGEKGAPANASKLAKELAHDRDGVTVRTGGMAAVFDQILTQSARDLVLMEALALPISLLALVWVFGGLYAALLPLTIGICALVGSLAVLRALSFFTDVSVFSLNLTVALGLALGIDYALLLVTRYRDEVSAGRCREDAILITMQTAGRTVFFSALTVALSLITLLFFPMYFLKSFAYAGVATVCISATSAMLLVPALLSVLGDRINGLDVRRLLRRVTRRPAPALPPTRNFWYRTAKAVMYRPLAAGLPLLLVLIFLGSPVLGMKFGWGDDRVLPRSASSRVVGDDLRANFNHDITGGITVVLPGANTIAPQQIANYATRLSQVKDIAAVSAPTGTYAGGRQVGMPGPGIRDGYAMITIDSTVAVGTPAADAQLDALHRVSAPPGIGPLFGGLTQITRDSVASIVAKLPLVVGTVAFVTLALLFLLTGSVVLPLKALMLNTVSLSATFGVLVWVFQDGNLHGLGTASTGTLVVSIVMLMFCVAFGLSMDYEVFLISRIREFWLESAGNRVDSDESVALGLAYTGRVVTAAAFLMAISFAALAVSQVSFMRMLGVGLAIAIIVDATIVRMVLLPAFMRVMGRLNWWAPKPLALMHQRLRPIG